LLIVLHNWSLELRLDSFPLKTESLQRSIKNLLELFTVMIFSKNITWAMNSFFCHIGTALLAQSPIFTFCCKVISSLHANFPGQNILFSPFVSSTWIYLRLFRIRKKLHDVDGYFLTQTHSCDSRSRIQVIDSWYQHMKRLSSTCASSWHCAGNVIPTAFCLIKPR
jgi:hypothetical protein